ncbi:MAG: hypothetical protein KatS3mg114_0250 [Planctomycetaceae bacterium]|nr:MAG: hypothetical protein KatS3mg114_0250 [Planctomycetaceae bacterium]
MTAFSETMLRGRRCWSPWQPSLSWLVLGWCGLCGVVGCSVRSESTSSPLRGDRPVASNRTGLTATETPLFWREVTAECGIDFTYRNGQETEHYAILESLGGGVACLDYDRDGWDDILVAGGGYYPESRQLTGYPAALYRQVGPWRFDEVTSLAGLDTPLSYTHGPAVADFDHDGFPDIVITGYGRLQCWHNQGDGTFREIAQSAQLTDSSWSSSAAWGDLNGDGHLDLYVAHYVNWSFDNDPFCPGPVGKRDVCPPRSFTGLDDTLFLSQGDGTFRDASREAGLLSEGKGLGVVLCDLDLDGDLDVYVTNDTVENFLYENDGQGRLSDRSLISGTALSDRGTPDGSMGVDLFDYNSDGLPDLWVVNYERESSALYQNLGHLQFRHVSQPLGVTAAGSMYVGWGTVCADFDHDGDEDIFTSNGHVIRYPVNAPLRQLPLVFENQAGRRFHNVAELAGEYTRQPHMGRGLATSDLDRDGDLDLVVSHNNEPVSVLMNASRTLGDWLQVELVGTRSPRWPIGSVVTLVTDLGQQVRHLRGGGSYASTHAPIIHFGLPARAQIQRLEIRWPSGEQQVITEIAPRRRWLVVESQSPEWLP